MKKTTQNKILALRCALLIAISESEKHRDTEEGGTSNMDTPVIFLPGWNATTIREAFILTGLLPDIRKDGAVYILRACEGQGYRRTAMAEAFRDSLKASGYNAGVDYRID
ncbi:MAG: hypothetical protein IKA64_03040 [Clostridia bacterium]|nr:hypothetical protein [Clostridia bacterium]